jgi:hypothetical protein
MQKLKNAQVTLLQPDASPYAQLEDKGNIISGIKYTAKEGAVRNMQGVTHRESAQAVRVLTMHAQIMGHPPWQSHMKWSQQDNPPFAGQWGCFYRMPWVLPHKSWGKQSTCTGKT